jgi:hypothetical protein
MLGKTTSAASLINSIKVPTLRADALLALARAHLRRGDFLAAKDTLFQVSPLVHKRSQATVYTAYLLARSGERVAAKRVFERAQEQLPPLSKPIPGPNARDAEHRVRFSEADHQRRYYESYLLKAGFVDEWLAFTASERPFLGTTVLETLFKHKRFGVVAQLARTDKPQLKIGNLVVVALALAEQGNDQAGALRLLAEAEELYRTLPPPRIAPDIGDEISAGDRSYTMVLLAYGHRRLGHEAAAQEWVQQAVTGQTPHQTAFLRTILASLPLHIARTRDITIAPAQLQQIDMEVAPQLPLLSESEQSYHILETLIQAQITAKQFEAAQNNLHLLQRFALNLLHNTEDSSGHNRALQVAKFWRQSGDEAQVQTLLKAIDEAPRPKDVTKSSVARLLIYNGFIEEGRARLATVSPSRSDKQHLPTLAYYEGKFRPLTFPEWIMKIKEPRERLPMLAGLSRALSDPVFEHPEERELVLSPDGYSASY